MQKYVLTTKDYFLLKLCFTFGGIFGVFPLNKKWNRASRIYSVFVNTLISCSYYVQWIPNKFEIDLTFINIVCVMSVTTFNFFSTYIILFHQKLLNDFFERIEEIDKLMYIHFGPSKRNFHSKFMFAYMTFLFLLSFSAFFRIPKNTLRNTFIQDFYMVVFLLGRSMYYHNLLFLFAFTWELTNNLSKRYRLLRQKIKLAIIKQGSVPTEVIENDLKFIGILYGKMFVVTQKFNQLFGKNVLVYFCHATFTMLRIYVSNWEHLKFQEGDFEIMGKFILSIFLLICVSITFHIIVCK